MRILLTLAILFFGLQAQAIYRVTNGTGSTVDFVNILQINNGTVSDGANGIALLSLPSSIGTVTSVAINNGDTFLTVNGSPIVGSGTITLDFDEASFLQNGNNLSELASASTARTNLGVAIGSDVQAYSSNLDRLALNNGASLSQVDALTLNGAASQTYLDNTDGQTISFSNPNLTIANGNSIDISAIDTDTNANTICVGSTTYLDGEGNCDDISSTYQASNGKLTTIAGLSPVNGEVLYGLNGSWAILQNGSHGQVLKVNGATLAWEADATGGGGSSEWTDNGDFLTPADGVTEKIVVGHNTNGIGMITLNGSMTFVPSPEPSNVMGYSYGELYYSSVDNNLHFLIDDTGTWIDTDLFAFGDVNGSGSTTDTAVAIWSGTSGKKIDESVVLIDAMGGITGADSITLGGSMANPLVVQTSQLVVDTSGNVGIDDSTPEYSLDVNAISRFTNTVNINNNKFIAWQDGMSTYNNIIGVNSSDQVVIQTFDDMMGNGAPIIFKSKPSTGETMRVTTDGYLGIGKTSPSFMLDVNGNASIAGNGQFMQSAYFDTVPQTTTSSASITVDWRTGNKQSIVLTRNASLAFTNPAGPTNGILEIHQGNGGSQFLTNISNGFCSWPDSTAPTLTTTANGVDILGTYFNGSTHYCQLGNAFGTP